MSKHNPIVRVQISRSAILHNYSLFKRAVSGLEVAPVLKSNAYGHGLVEVAEILQKCDAPFFVVDSLYEARRLRQVGIMTPLLVIGYVPVKHIIQNKFSDVFFTIIDINQLRQLVNEVSRPVTVHIKFDTGMHRQGIMMSDLEEAAKLLKGNPKILVEGICTHLCDADNENSSVTMKQLQCWKEILQKWGNVFGAVKWKHIAATHGVKYTNDGIGNLVRVGIGLYGVVSTPVEGESLRPVLSMHTEISSVRRIEVGETVGYNATFTASSERKIATVPVGYYEGVDRRLSNVGALSVKGKMCPVVGRVSMNITSIDVTGISDCVVGDDVIVISDNSALPNSVVAMATQAKTIPYEILIHIPPHLRRTVID